MQDKGVTPPPEQRSSSWKRFVSGFILLLGFAGAVTGTYLFKVEQKRMRHRYEEMSANLETRATDLYRKPGHDISKGKKLLLQQVDEMKAELRAENFQDEAWAKGCQGRAIGVLGRENEAISLLLSAWDGGIRDQNLLRGFGLVAFSDPIFHKNPGDRDVQLRQLALKISDQDYYPDTALGKLIQLFSAGKFNEVLEAAGRIEEPPSPWLLSGLEAAAYCGLGDAKIEQGRLESAQVEYRLAVLVTEKMAQYQPSNPLSYLMMAHLYCRMYEAELMEKGHSIPNYLDAAMNAVRLAMRVEPDHQKAADLYRKLQKMQSDAVN